MEWGKKLNLMNKGHSSCNGNYLLAGKKIKSGTLEAQEILIGLERIYVS